MSLMDLLPQNKWHLLISASAVLLTLCSLLAISISMDAAYMWLIIVLMTVLFLTTFTFTSRPNFDEIETPITENFDEVSTVSRSQPYWIMDTPPTYAHATGLPSGNTPPPSYSKVPFLPPIYERKTDLHSLFKHGRHGSYQHNHLPEIFSPRYGTTARHGSIDLQQSDHLPQVFSPRYGRHGSLDLQRDHLPEVFSTRFGLRHGSLSSVQTLHFHVIENH